MQIPIVYEDDALLIVNKPNNMLVHPSYYARNIKTTTLVEILSENKQQKIFPIHRLDHKTSGIIIFAKTAIYAAKMQKQFANNTIKKEYFALVRGFTNPEGIIDTPVKNADTGKYKDALTHYKTMDTVEVPIAVQPYEKSRYSLVQLFPKTGRMHQLRKHLNKISHPIIGDHKYGNRHHNKMFAEKLHLPNLFLHAKSIDFIHPEKEISLKLTSDFPVFWNKTMLKLNWELDGFK